jgi:DNA ligase 1
MSSKDRVLLAHNITSHPIDPTGWYMSEKQDGIRAVWDGSALRTREHWNIIAAPPDFTAHLPAGIALDGELCYPERGYKRFQDLVSAVRKSVPDPKAWAGVLYQIFDAPDCPVGTHGSTGFEPFETRLERARYLAKDAGAHVRVLDQIRCEGRAHLDAALAAVLKAGGEGIMLRKPGSLYTCSRSATLLKCKGTQDAEATVIGYTDGEVGGRREGLVGALRCKFDNGVEFKVGGGGGSDDVWKHPPPIGSRITVRYDALSRDGKPRAPRYIATRDYE